MQAQAFEGYWENERFYPNGKPIRKTGRQRAVLTFLSEPLQQPTSEQPIFEVVSDSELPEGFDRLVEKAGLEEAHRRVAWLKRLAEARDYAKDAPSLEIPPRAKDMRAPVVFED